MKTLLVPTNFTDVSKNALDYAIALAAKLKTKITLLHAYHPFLADPGHLTERYKEELDIFRQEAEIKLDRRCTEVNKTSSHRCDFVNIEGLAKDIIVSYANESQPDLLVIGTESLSPLDRIVFGTVTGKVLKEANCDLLVIPEKAAYKPPKKMAFAMDYHDNDLEEIKLLMQLSKKFKSEIHIIHVVEDDENIKFEQSFFEDFQREVKQEITGGKIAFTLIKGKDTAKAIEKFINEHGIDLLAVSKTRKNILERLFSGSVSKKLFYHTHIPLLIFQAEDKSENQF